MKKLAGLIAIAVCGFVGMTTNVQAVSTNALTVNIQMIGLSQKLPVAVTNGNVATTTLTTTPVKLGNSDILKMLETEFNTNFPAGAQLGVAVAGIGFVVLDKNGDTILNVGSNPLDLSYGFSLSNNVTGAGVQDLTIGKSVQNTVTGNETEVLTLDFPDYGVFYADSHGNNFHFIGLVFAKANATVVSDVTTYNTFTITMNGTGGGSISNTNVCFTSAKFNATGKNLTAE